MIVSGGKILAIGKVKTDTTTVSGDGVKNPIGVNGGIKTYAVEAGNENVTVNSAYDGNLTIFKIKAAGGGSGSSTYSAYPGGQIKVDNVDHSLAIQPAFILSASSGYNALGTIQENSAAWLKDTTYNPGANIDITNDTISGRDWTPELNTKVNTDLFNTWSAGVESSAANLSAAIDSLPKPKYYDDVSATVANNSANWNSVYGSVEANSANWNTTYTDFGANSAKWNDTTKTLTDNSANWNSVYSTVDSSSADWNEVSAKLDSADFTKFQTHFNTWSAGVDSSAASMSAYIKDNEEYWNNSSYNAYSKTPNLLSIESAYDPLTRTTTFGLSAAAGNSYSAGNWIDSEKLQEGTIEVSGQKTFKTKWPMYFSADSTDQNIVWLLHDDTEIVKTTKAILIANGFNGGTYYTNDATLLSAVVPAKDINAEYIFHFGKQMGVQININAKFVAHASASDKIGTVGFGAASIGSQQFTNPITFNMLGALGEQYYCASTIARVNSADFPNSGVDLSFKFIGDSDFLKEIQNPCISMHEIVNEA